MPKNAHEDLAAQAAAAAFDPEAYEPPPLPEKVDIVTMDTLIGTVDAKGRETEGIVGQTFELGLNQLATYEPDHVLFPRDFSQYPPRAMEILNRADATAVASIMLRGEINVQTGYTVEQVFGIKDRVATYTKITKRGLRVPTAKAAELMRVYKQFLRAVPLSELKR